MPLKITILQGAFLPVPPKMGGAVEKMWYALGKEFGAQGHEVTHISRTFDGLSNEEHHDNVHYKRVKGYSTPSSGLYLKWLDFLYTKRAIRLVPSDSDIVITNTFWAPVLLGAGMKKKCVIDVQRMPKGQMKLYKKSSRYRANSTPVHVAIKNELPAYCHKKVITIPNPLPFHNAARVDFAKKKKIFLYVGRIHPEKGLDLLIKAFSSVPSDWQLKIVGPWEVSAGGGGAPYLKALKKLDLNKQVIFIEPVYNLNELNLIYQEASIFIYPSIAEMGETFGLAPLEAMAWGCVPVVSNLACFHDFIQHQHNGIIFDHRDPLAIELLRDAMINLQQDDLNRFELGQQALRVNNSHSVSSISSLFLAEFSRMKSEVELGKQH